MKDVKAEADKRKALSLALVMASTTETLELGEKTKKERRVEISLVSKSYKDWQLRKCYTSLTFSGPVKKHISSRLLNYAMRILFQKPFHSRTSATNVVRKVLEPFGQGIDHWTLSRIGSIKVIYLYSGNAGCS